LLGFRILVWVKNRQLNKIKILDDRQTITLTEEQGEIPETIHNSTKH